MSSSPKEASDTPAAAESSSLARRDLLRYAAGALALGLGTPLEVLADDGEEWMEAIKFSFYQFGDSTPLQSFVVTRELARMLREGNAQLTGKVTWVSKVDRQAEPLAVYRLSPLYKRPE